MLFRSLNSLKDVIRMFAIIEAEAERSCGENHHVDCIRCICFVWRCILHTVGPETSEIVVGEIFNLLLNLPVQDILYRQWMYPEC